MTATHELMMVALTYFFGVLVVAALFGYFVYRFSSPAHRLRSILLASATAILVIGLSAVAFLYAIASYPPTDDPRFENSNSIFIEREGKLPTAHRSGVRLVFPYRVRKGSDFEILLVLSTSPPLTSGNYISELKGPESLEFRPQTNCSMPVGPTAACKAIKEQKSAITLAWDVTPTEEAEATLRVSIPEIWPDSGDWSASLTFDGHEPLVANPRDYSRDAGKVMLNPDQPQFKLTENTPFEQSLVITESDRWYEQARPSYAVAGADIDLDTRVIRFPIQVVTSLGLNSATYGWLALGGVAFSGMFGSGWLWKILELFRARRELGGSGLTSLGARALREAIIESFDYPSLSIVLADMSPSRDLDAIVTKGPFIYQVAELIAVASREGWIGSFLQSALNARANKASFVAVVRPIADQIAAKVGTESAPTVPH